MRFFLHFTFHLPSDNLGALVTDISDPMTALRRFFSLLVQRR